MQRLRASSAKRASSIRAEAAQHKEQVESAREKIAKEKAHARLVVKKDESVAHEVQDMRLKASNKKKKRREKTKEELDEISQQWVTVGRGAYNYSDLDNPVYLRSMQKAELDLYKQNTEKQLKRRQAVAAEIRRNEREIMQKKAGVTARYNLPIKDVPTTKKEGEDDDNDGAEQGEGEEGTPKKKKVKEPREVRLDRRREHDLLERKTKILKKSVDQDIDAAAKLLILHAHLIRRACVEAKAATSKEEGDAEKEE